MGLKSYVCSGRRLQNAIKNGILLTGNAHQEINTMITLTKSFIRMFKKSSKAKYEISTMSSNFKSLKQSTPTRWNSVYYSFESMLHLKAEIIQYVKSHKKDLPDTFSIFS